MEVGIRLFLVVTSFFVHQSQAQNENTGRIYTTPADSKDGAFVFPRAYPLTFREGSSINISWSTTFSNVNLFYYQRGKVATSIQLATNQAVSWYQWTVHADEANLTEPFVFRAVNGRGTDADAKTGGFWSASYYIVRTNEAGISSSVVSSVTQNLISLSSSTPSPASSVWSSSEQHQTPAPSTLLGTAQLPSSTTPGSLDSSPPPPPRHPSSGVSQSAIIGLSTGLSIAFLIIVGALGIVLWRRRKHWQTSPFTPLVASRYREDENALKPVHFETVQHAGCARPEEMEGSRPVFELPTEKEMPSIGQGM